MRIDFSKIVSARKTGGELEPLFREMFGNCPLDDPPPLGDILANIPYGGQDVMLELGGRFHDDNQSGLPPEQRFRWRILVLKDEWGNKPRAGDVVVRKIQKKLMDRAGHVIGGDQLSADKLTGVYDEKWIRKINYPVDDRGCITCTFQDAVFFLNTRGVHYKKRKPVGTSIHPEFSTEPVRAPDGNMLHVHYWLYTEVDRKAYSKLPVIKERTEHKRGYIADEAYQLYSNDPDGGSKE